MKKIITLLIAGLITFSTVNALENPANASPATVVASFNGIDESIAIDNPLFSNWKEAWRNFKDGMGTIEYIPKDQDINNWHDLFTVEYFDYKYSTDGKNAPVQTWVDRYINAIKNICPKGQISNPEILNQKDEEITIFWNAKGCGTDNVTANQLEVTRFMRGSKGMHVVRYTVKGDSVTDEQKQKMLNFVNAAYIKK